MERLAVTLARRILTRLRSRGVLEEPAAPVEVVELLQLEAVRVPPSRTAVSPTG